MKKMILPLLILFTAFPFALSAADAAQTIKLPEPDKKGGMPLMQALTERKTTRNFQPGKITDQTLSDLLYAGCGFNRPDKLVIPTAMNRQDITLYVALENGTYRYDGKGNKLDLVAAGDNRSLTGMSKATTSKTLCSFIIVSDTNQFNKEITFPAVHAGAVMQDLYLCCASKGLATVTYGSFDKEGLKKLLKLKDGEVVILTQQVGNFVEADKPAAAPAAK